MIVGMSHCALGSTDLDADTQYLESLGYRKVFLEHDLENISIKRPLLKEFTRYHSIALFKKSGCIDLELISYASSQKPSIPSWLSPQFQESLLQTSCNATNIYTQDLTASLGFWTLFGFKVLEQTATKATLVLRSMMQAQQFYLHLGYSDVVPGPIFLDDAVANCLAFITTSVVKEEALLAQKGLQTTAIQTLVVNGQKLSLFFVQGPQYEVVEIIGLER